jgi:hypothetical protein
MLTLPAVAGRANADGKFVAEGTLELVYQESRRSPRFGSQKLRNVPQGVRRSGGGEVADDVDHDVRHAGEVGDGHFPS